MDGTIRRELKHALSDVYQTCGSDLGWSDDTPDDDTFVDVIRDLFASRDGNDCSREAFDVWQSLSYAEKRKLILEVGP